jgi:hypothetical protein
LDVNTYPDDIAVPSFGPRMVCVVCGAIDEIKLITSPVLTYRASQAR